MDRNRQCAKRGEQKRGDEDGLGRKPFHQQPRRQGHDGIGDEHGERQVTKLRLIQVERSLQIGAHRIHEIRHERDDHEHEHDQRHDAVIVFHNFST